MSCFVVCFSAFSCHSPLSHQQRNISDLIIREASFCIWGRARSLQWQAGDSASHRWQSDLLFPPPPNNAQTERETIDSSSSSSMASPSLRLSRRPWVTNCPFNEFLHKSRKIMSTKQPPQLYSPPPEATIDGWETDGGWRGPLDGGSSYSNQ